MKKIAVMLAEGFEEIEAFATTDILRRAGFQCELISIAQEMVKGAHGILVKADKLISDEIKTYDMLVFPGGMPGAANLASSEKIIELTKYFYADKSKYIAAICASPAVVFSAAGITENQYITSYPGEDFESLLENANYVEELVVVDGNMITSRGPATTMLFAYTLVDILGGNSDALKEGMLWNMLEEEN